MDINKFEDILTLYGQQHLLRFKAELSTDELIALIKDIENIKIPDVVNYFNRTTNVNEDFDEKLDDKLQAVPEDVYGSAMTSTMDDIEKYENIGLKEIAQGNVGVILLAGGQGTRLGVNYPKGMYNVGLPSGKTLYQLQAERIRRLEYLAASKYPGTNGKIQWYIMTSEHTKEPTLEFFAKHSYFGLNKDNLTVFEQGMLPCFTFDGKIILDDKGKISKAPDGNGGLYRALREKKILNDIEDRGVKYLHVYCVDNILVKLADPVFIGYCISKNADCGAKTVEKTIPTEPVGVVCKVKGKYQVVEYSEITLKTAQKRNEDGRLTFSAGNICNHYFTTQFLRNVIDNKEDSLMHHVAKKKIPFVDENGIIVKPSTPNGIKMEKFVFDVFQFSERFAVWDVERSEEFSPLKNADGVEKDTPTTAREDLYSLHYRYIKAAGGVISNAKCPTLNGNSNGYTNGHSNGNGIHHDEDNNNVDKSTFKNGTTVMVCEISPLISYAGEGLMDLVGGKKLQAPVTLKSIDE